MSSLMWPWPERMVSGLKPTKLSWLAVVKKTPQPSCLSWMVLQKTKTKTASRSLFWLPKIRTLKETIEERCGRFWSSWGLCLFRSLVDQDQKSPTQSLLQIFGSLLSWEWLCLALALLDLPLLLLLCLPQSPRHLIRFSIGNVFINHIRSYQQKSFSSLPQSERRVSISHDMTITLSPKYKREWKIPWSTQPNHCRKGKTDQAVVVLNRLGRTKEATHLANQHTMESRTKKKVNNRRNKIFAAGIKEPDKTALKGQNVCKALQLVKTPMSWFKRKGKGNFKEELQLRNWKKQLLGISKATILVFLHEWGGCNVVLQHSILILIQGA